MQTKPVSNDVLLRQLRWRYATKKFDPTRQISTADWQTLEEALVLSPSSFGLQPWKFLVVNNPAIREKLVPISWGQRQLIDASHVVVFAIKKDIGLREIDDYIARIVEVRGPGSRDAANSLRQMIVGNIIDGPRRAIVDEWARHQLYIALGNFMTSAALLGIDTCPMEGIETAKYDEVLGLAARGLATTVVGVAGYRAADDRYAALPKVRFKSEDVIERI